MAFVAEPEARIAAGLAAGMVKRVVRWTAAQQVVDTGEFE